LIAMYFIRMIALHHNHYDGIDESLLRDGFMGIL